MARALDVRWLFLETRWHDLRKILADNRRISVLSHRWTRKGNDRNTFARTGFNVLTLLGSMLDLDCVGFHVLSTSDSWGEDLSLLWSTLVSRSLGPDAAGGCVSCGEWIEWIVRVREGNGLIPGHWDCEWCASVHPRDWRSVWTFARYRRSIDHPVIFPPSVWDLLERRFRRRKVLTSAKSVRRQRTSRFLLLASVISF